MTVEERHPGAPCVSTVKRPTERMWKATETCQDSRRDSNRVLREYTLVLNMSQIVQMKKKAASLSEVGDTAAS